jgi:hypothetical protein
MKDQRLRLKTVRKIHGFSNTVFHIFRIIFILYRKYSKRYENRIACHENRLGYGWTSIQSVFVLGGEIR